MEQQPQEPQVMEHRAHVGVECPQCHARQFLEIQLEQPVENSPAVKEIRRQLESWIASRCPDHLGPILNSSKN
ncbi:MAG TPA: hypothetical protein VMW54_00825 [Terriglobia bacterium]|nr:hypothetical protein [Terriglobia bacterium]